MASVSVASTAVFPPSWAVFQTHWAGSFWQSRVAVFWAVSELAAGIGLPRFWAGTNGQLIQLMS